MQEYFPTTPHFLVKLRRWFCWRMHVSEKRVCMFITFTIIAMTVGILTVYFTSPKPGGTCKPIFRRMMNSSIISNSRPRCVAVGDLNNDHQIDIVVANSGTDAIGIFLAKGDGIFAGQQTYPTGSGSRPYSVVISDFNNDTYLDIAVANYGTNSIGIFLGNGDGTFIGQKLFSTGSSHPLFITIGDFNNDNRTDIVVANYGTNSIGILLGFGNGSFQDQTIFSIVYDSIPYSLVVADFNKDNQLDIAVANYGTNNIGILLGHGNGTFATQKTYTTTPNSHPSSIAVGDFNNDNHLDIVVSNNGTGNIGIFLGHGNGTFLAQRTYLIGSNSYPQYITVDDFDQDSELDIVIVDSDNGQIHILIGNGTGNFTRITTYDTISGYHPLWVAVADFNNDNRSDLVVANSDTNNVLVLIDYSFKPSARTMKYFITNVHVTDSAVVNDFNNDGLVDLVGDGGDHYIFIRNGLANGTFGMKAVYSIEPGSVPRYVCAGDLNNDKQMDIVIANPNSDSASVLLGYGNGTFAPAMSHYTGSVSLPYWVALGDLNHDNILDIISANKGTNSIGIHLGNGDGTFATMASYPTVVGTAPYAVAIGDVNNDTHLDFVVADENTVVIIFLGYGNGSFSSWKSYSIGRGSILFTIALADFNNDNCLDIAVTNPFADNVDVFLGYGDGTFTEQTSYSTGSGSQPHYVIVADFNNDNIHDIAVTNYGSDEIVIFYGYGNGSFELARRYPTGSGSKPSGITTAHFNNSKQLEIVVVLSEDRNIAVLSEYYAAEFAKQTIHSTGSAPQPFSVGVGDFNNDNRSDVVVANSGTDNLRILLNSGNGTFDMEITYAIGTDSYPQYVITSDINKDNQLDIVTVNAKGNSISVIMGYGNGSFAERTSYSTTNDSHPYAVVAGDMNNDNRLDLIVVNKGTDSIGIFFGFNYTSFQSQQTYPINDNSSPAGIVVSDFNNDKFLDIAATLSGSDSLSILLGYGNGSFNVMMIYSTGKGSEPNGIAAGDFNNDGRMDIVVVNAGTNSIGVLLGHGNGSFADIITYSTGKNSHLCFVAVGDLNNDDLLDIVVVVSRPNYVGVLLGYGNGHFSIVNTYSTGQGSIPKSVAIGDFNNDDRMDIVVCNFGTEKIGVRLGYGNGTFGDQMTFTTGSFSSPISVMVGDFNGDNRLDIATANSNLNNIGIFLGHGNGIFTGVRFYSTGTGSVPYFVSVGEFNNDNHLDIAIANYGTDNIVILFGVGDGSFLLGTAYSTGAGSKPYALAIGDFNNDTRLDIATANRYANSIGILLGHENEFYASITEYTTGDGSQPHSVAIGDFNNDSLLDIVVANYGTNSIGILLGRSNRVFDPIMTYSTGNGSGPYSVAIADFNNDHHLDIVVTNSKTDDIAIFLGCDNGTFVMRANYSTGFRSRPYKVIVDDFDNDTKLDIAIANSGTNNIFLLYGYEDGIFVNEFWYPLGYGYHPYSIAVTDLNGDDRMDIVIACYDTGHVETLIQICQ